VQYSIIENGPLGTAAGKTYTLAVIGARVPLAPSAQDGPSRDTKAMDTSFQPQPNSHPPTKPEPDSKSDPEQGSLSPLAPRYSIAAVSKLTGISCHTLRVWERRYGFPVPERSASGHRRYDRSQVQMLCRMSDLNRSSRQPIGELITRLQVDSPEPAEPEVPSRKVDDAARAKLVHRLIAGQSEEAERQYASFASQLDPLGLVNQVIHPALIDAGEGWFRRSYCTFEERLITVFLRQKLVALIAEARQQNTQPVRSVLTGTVQGDRHEGGVLIFNLVMELRGWRVHNLGVDLPVREYVMAVERLRPSALALSFILSRNIKKRFQELGEVDSVPVFVGGRSIVNYQSMARSHGLIPLTGPISKSSEQLQAVYDTWCHQHHICP
jgi:DNA-binding transcriptional MerR regulator